MCALQIDGEGRREGADGRVHWEQVKLLMSRLTASPGGRTGASLALGWDGDVMLAYHLAHFMRCHGSE